jgi:hypothetical protein
MVLFAIATFVLAPMTLLPYLINPYDHVRLRNAVSYEAAPLDKFQWTPANVPGSFLMEKGPIDPLFSDVITHLGLNSLATDWDRIVAIQKNLMELPLNPRGPPIQSDLRTTYRRIVVDGDGYCADFVRVFRALATAADIPVRSWAFSVDGFGGDGHAWLEFWNRQTGQWQLLDVFNNFYFTDRGKPLSALDFRHALESGSPTLEAHRIDELVPPGYKYIEKAWDFYRHGLDGWYLYWGNIPFTYERTWIVRVVSPVTRAGAQLGALLMGYQPRPILLETPGNGAAIDALQRLRIHLILVFSTMALSVLAVLYLVIIRPRWRIRFAFHIERIR